LLAGVNNEIAISRLVSSSVKFQLSDFTPIGLIASQPIILVASNKRGVKNINQFLSRVKSMPRKYSYASSGIGTALHLAGEMVKDQSGLLMTYISYRGVAPLANDLLGNNIEFGFFVLSSGLPHIRSGRVTALGTTETKRSFVTPDLSAFAENPKLKEIDINIWFALMGSAKLPETVLSKLQKALAESLQSPNLNFSLTQPEIDVWRAGDTGTEGVWQFNFSVPGRHVMISALIHGNELYGAWALQGLLKAAVRL
jgi:tripartite-type tricarboxylate transporter receptor subunit TctC